MNLIRAAIKNMRWNLSLKRILNYFQISVYGIKNILQFKSSRKIFHDNLWVLSNLLIPALLTLATMPYLNENMDNFDFGFLIIIWTVLVFISQLDMGAGRAVIIMCSKYRNHQTYRASHYFLVAVGITLSFSTLAGLLLVAISKIDNRKYEYLDLDLDLIIVLILLIQTTALLTISRALLESEKNFKSSSLNRTVGSSVTIILPVIQVATNHYSVENYLILLLIFRIVLLIDALKNASIPNINIIQEIRKSQELYEFVKLWKWFALSSIIGPALVYGDRFLIAEYVGTESLKYYALPLDLFLKLTIISSVGMTVALPYFSKIIDSKRGDIKRVVNWLYIMNFSICLPAFVLAPYILELWLDSEFNDKSGTLARILIMGIYFNCNALVLNTTINSGGDSKSTALIHLVEFIVYFPLLYITILSFGLTGAAILWAARNIIDFLFLVKIYYWRQYRGDCQCK